MEYSAIKIGNEHISIKSLHQWQTYAGLLEGLPTDRMNENILKRVSESAKKYTHIDTLHIIEPTQMPIAYEGKYPFGTPMQLPGYVCVAELSKFGAARDKNRDGSMLALVWFQEEYAFPIKAEILKKMEQLNWNELAEDFDY